MSSAIETVTIDLSMKNPETDAVLTANLYNVDGLSHPVSMGGLVMAICLQRATELEEEVVKKMQSMTKCTVDLEALTTIQEALVTNDSLTSFGTISDLTYYAALRDSSGNLTGELSSDTTTYESISDNSTLMIVLEDLGVTDLSATTAAELVTAIGTRMDALNSLNQEEMIELQSLTNKRDQSYDLITNTLKSLHNVLLGVANNI